jgi:hypothetical protein
LGRLEKKLFGPVHVYVVPGLPVTDKLIVLFSHTGLLLVAVGAAGMALTTTLVVPAILVHPFTVAVTEYIPPLVAATLVNDGFCADDVKPFGPVQL